MADTSYDVTLTEEDGLPRVKEVEVDPPRPFPSERPGTTEMIALVLEGDRLVAVKGRWRGPSGEEQVYIEYLHEPPPPTTEQVLLRHLGTGALVLRPGWEHRPSINLAEDETEDAQQAEIERIHREGNPPEKAPRVIEWLERSADAWEGPERLLENLRRLARAVGGPAWEMEYRNLIANKERQWALVRFKWWLSWERKQEEFPGLFPPALFPNQVRALRPWKMARAIREVFPRQSRTFYQEITRLLTEPPVISLDEPRGAAGDATLAGILPAHEESEDQRRIDVLLEALRILRDELGQVGHALEAHYRDGVQISEAARRNGVTRRRVEYADPVTNPKTQARLKAIVKDLDPAI